MPAGLEVGSPNATFNCYTCSPGLKYKGMRNLSNLCDNFPVHPFHLTSDTNEGGIYSSSCLFLLPGRYQIGPDIGSSSIPKSLHEYLLVIKVALCSWLVTVSSGMSNGSTGAAAEHEREQA